MSVEPRNRLWNRLLARAEARAAKGTPPEPHHYNPVLASDDHLRSSFENSLIYHGLKIETEFNLRVQRPPRKRKAKRKSDLPIAERLRNDRAAAGSPGPTHRTPTGTPTRRISKSTPLSRPPIPIPPPLPPIPVSTRAAAARDRVLNAVSDDDGSPAPRNPSVVELSDSSDDVISRARSTKPDSGSAVSRPNFDLAADSNDTSLWEEHAILIAQPSKVDDRDNNRKLGSKDTVGVLEKKSSSQDLRAPYKTSKKDRARRVSARKIASSDSSLAGDSDSGRNKHAKEPKHRGKLVRNSSRQPLKRGISPVKHRTAVQGSLETSYGQPSGSSNGEGSSRKKVSKRANTVDDDKTSDMQNSSNSPLTEDLIERISKLTKKDSIGASRPNDVVCSGSSSDEEHPNNYRSSPPMRALLPRRRTPPNVSVEDRLFGKLSLLSSPRRRTRSMSDKKKRPSLSDTASSPTEKLEGHISRREEMQTTCDTFEATGRKTERPTDSAPQTPLRRTSRRLDRCKENRKRNRQEEVIATSPTNMKATTPRKSSSPTASLQQQKRVKQSIEEGSLGDLSDEIFDVDLLTVDVSKIQNLPENIKRNKTPPSSSLSESTIEVEESSGTRRNSVIQRKLKKHDIPLSVNTAFPGQHRVTPIVLEGTENGVDILEILDGDSDGCLASVSPIVKRRRVTRKTRDSKRVYNSESQEKQQPKQFSTRSVSRNSIRSPEAKKQANRRNGQSGVNLKLPLRIHRNAIPQEHLNRATKDSSSEKMKKEIGRDVRTRKSAAAQEHLQANSERAQEKKVDSTQKVGLSSAIDLQAKSKRDIQASPKRSLPLRIRRRILTEEGPISGSKSPRSKSSDRSQDAFRSPSKNSQKQTKRDTGSSSTSGLPLRNRRRTVIQKQKKASPITPRVMVWDSLSERMKERIQKAMSGEGECFSDDSFDSDVPGRKRRRKYAVYHDGRAREITDGKA